MTMHDALGILLALLTSYAGMACLSLAMPRHFDQVWHRDPSASHARALRAAGVLLLGLALLPCVALWGNTVGVVAWLGWLSAGALLWVGMLSWAPRPAAGTAALAVAISLAGVGIGF
ncbi:DUF3325 domain-containing protein [Achromobacter sp. Marseille-Q0513]|uniref:DUF3325 domain-containing protein n=1 Tax=Achromobacter sp. Marseille-Q0513 TaxID=2829161 RepID=UPI001B9C657F|nr:DUF3325 domain-containing protein [Achromobacter sp. Marseille-Q0513]MBR8656498.1 DUF3325 domain-containing protein [Achromobacter sp. Marseille-Q0513]